MFDMEKVKLSTSPEKLKKPDKSKPATYQEFVDFYIDNMDLPYGTSMPYFQYHNVYELFIVKKGHKRYMIEDETFDLTPFELVIVRPYEIHRTVSLDNLPQSRLILYFGEKYFDRFADVVERCSLFDCLKLRKLKIPASHKLKFTKLLNRITSMDNDDLADPLKYAVMQCLMFELLCQLHETAAVSPHIIKNSPQIERAVEYIGKNYKSGITLESAADEVFLSPSYFSALFRKCTGMTFSSYLRNIRIENAIRLLLDSDESITGISAECGFSSPNYFKDVFRRVTGVSPSRYRLEADDEYQPKFKPPDDVPMKR